MLSLFFGEAESETRMNLLLNGDLLSAELFKHQQSSIDNEILFSKRLTMPMCLILHFSASAKHCIKWRFCVVLCLLFVNLCKSVLVLPFSFEIGSVIYFGILTLNSISVSLKGARYFILVRLHPQTLRVQGVQALSAIEFDSNKVLHTNYCLLAESNK